MSISNEHLEVLNEIIDGIDNGDFDNPGAIPDRYTYAHLYVLFSCCDQLDGGRELFEQLYNVAIESGLERIREKVRNNERIKVGFISCSATQWPAEGIYRLFEADDRFEVSIILAGMTERDPEVRLSNYSQSLLAFKERGYNVVEAHDINTDTPIGWETIGIPDLMFHVSTWSEYLFPELQFIYLPFCFLNIYVPYGFYVADGLDGSYYSNIVCNKWFNNLMWKMYTESVENLDGLKKYELLSGKNALYSGYPKMDHFFTGTTVEDDLWPIPDGRDASEYKRVIIAPHFTIGQNGVILFSTFQNNLWFLLYLAQKYSDSISFIFKPHPNLKASAVKTGLFSGYEEYDEYLSKWDALPNAKVVQEGDYLEFFRTSDGMILDSASFIAEYMYTGKPCLFLTRPEQRFNELGEKIMEVCYRTDGKDYLSIERFLDTVIRQGDDDMYERRKILFDSVLDYRDKNGCLASEYVYRDLVGELFGP